MENYWEVNSEFYNSENMNIVNSFLLNQKIENKSIQTVLRHRSILQRFFSSQTKPFTQISTEEIMHWLTEQQKSRSERTIYEFQKSLRVFLNFTVLEKHMEKSPLHFKPTNYWEVEIKFTNSKNKEIVNSFLESQIGEGFSKETILRQRSTLQQFFCTQTKLFTAIKTEDLKRWLNEQATKRTKCTIDSHYLKSLRTFYTYCVREKYMDKSPLQDFKKPGTSSKKFWELRIQLANHENTIIINKFLHSLKIAKKSRHSIAARIVNLQYFFTDNEKLFSTITQVEIECWFKENKESRNKSILGTIRSALMLFYEFCVKEGIMEKNPIKPEGYWVMETQLPNEENKKLVNQYLLNLKNKNRSKGSIENNKFILQKFFSHTDIHFSQINTNDVEQWFIKQNNNLKSKTKSQYMSILRRLYRFCDESGYANTSPIKFNWEKGEGIKKYWISQKPFKNKENQDLVNEYLLNMKLENLSPLTIGNCKIFLDNYFQDKQEHLSTLTYDDMLEWLKQQQGSFKKSTVKNRFSFLTTFFQFCMKEGHIEAIPIKQRWSPKLAKPVPRYLEKEEVARVRSVSEKRILRNRVMVEFLLSSGCRVSEMQMLDIKEVDLENRNALVTGKGKKIRNVYFSETCALLLERYLENRSDNHPAVFISKLGGRLSTQSIYQIVKQMGEDAEITGPLYPHRFRHTFSTDFRTKGAGLPFIADLLGHKNLQTTRIYARKPKWKLIKMYRMYMG